MKKPWSISTTVRNPERLRAFLSVLKSLEGQPFSQANQIKFQILLIQEKLYRPTNMPKKYKDLFDDPSSKITFKQAKEMFELKEYVGTSIRGRQSANPLNKLGFCVARQGKEKIIITELGNRFLQGDYDLSFVFFKSLLKLQYPNDWSGDFKKDDGFDIMPLIAVMKLIKQVNSKSGLAGLDSREFKVFVPTLINASEIENQADRIIGFRKEKNKDKAVRSYAKEFYDTKNVDEKKINNLYDYGDNIMRYFKLTKFFRIETDPMGSHWHIDLETSRLAEIEQLIDMYDGHALKFKDMAEYMKYISDIEKPELPWEKEENLRKVAAALKTIVIEFAREKNIEFNPAFNLDVDIGTLGKTDLNNLIANLRTLNIFVKEKARKIELMTDQGKLVETIKVLKDAKLLRKYSPEQFERLIADALKILNDEILIKPNYVKDDNGEPIYHAPPGPDIECFYETYDSICEVTLNLSRSQWIQETQPVMRHLRDFEDKRTERTAICLFVAPLIHNDTLSQFWFSVKYEYNGKSQKIIPLTTGQLAMLLETLHERIKKGKRLTHAELFSFYSSLFDEIKNINSFSEWTEKIASMLIEWKRKAIA